MTTQTNWILRFEGYHPFHRAEAFFEGERKKVVFCSDYNELMGISKNKRLQVYYIKKDLERISKKSFKILKNKKKVYSYMKLVTKNNNNLINFIEDTIFKINLLSNEELAKRYEKMMQMFEILVCSYDFSRPEYAEKTGIKIKEHLLSKGITKNDLNKIFEILTITQKYILLDYEEIDWLTLIQDMKNISSHNKIIHRLKMHQKKYGWIGTSEQKKKWSLDYYKKIFTKDIKMSEKELKKRIKINKNKKQELKKKQSILISKFGINRKVKYLLYIIRELAHIRITTRFIWVKSSFLMREIFKEISKRTGVDNKYLEWYNTKEIKDLLVYSKKVDLKKIKERNNFAFIIRDNKLEFYEGEKKVKQLESKEITKKDYSNITEIKGNPANLGYAIGKVKIIYPFSKNQQQEIDKMKKGQVLVTSMTRPHLIMAMKKSAGIITDEGGITSHAAIVSRELNIPCIIGTKIATKVFKDNDLVEVDANKGIVKLLKKEK